MHQLRKGQVQGTTRDNQGRHQEPDQVGVKGLRPGSIITLNPFSYLHAPARTLPTCRNTTGLDNNHLDISVCVRKQTTVYPTILSLHIDMLISIGMGGSRLSEAERRVRRKFSLFTRLQQHVYVG